MNLPSARNKDFRKRSIKTKQQQSIHTRNPILGRYDQLASIKSRPNVWWSCASRDVIASIRVMKEGSRSEEGLKKEVRKARKKTERGGWKEKEDAERENNVRARNNIGAVERSASDRSGCVNACVRRDARRSWMRRWWGADATHPVCAFRATRVWRYFRPRCPRCAYPRPGASPRLTSLNPAPFHFQTPARLDTSQQRSAKQSRNPFALLFRLAFCDTPCRSTCAVRTSDVMHEFAHPLYPTLFPFWRQTIPTIRQFFCLSYQFFFFVSVHTWWL